MNINIEYVYIYTTINIPIYRLVVTLIVKIEQNINFIDPFNGLNCITTWKNHNVKKDSQLRKMT